MRNLSLLVFCLFFSFILSAQTTELKKGYRKNFYKNGKVESEGAEKKGQKEKLWKYYDSTGVLLKTENYLHGKLNGEQRRFLGTQTYARTMYVNGLQDGMSYLYFPNGQVQQKSLYKNDSIVYQYSYTMQGLASVVAYEHNLQTGIARYY